MFDIYRTLDLGYLGDSWEGCYLKFRPLVIREVQEMAKIDSTDQQKATETAVKILTDKFIEGRAMEDGKQVEVTKTSLQEFPVAVLLDAIKALSEGLDKKKEIASTMPSKE